MLRKTVAITLTEQKTNEQKSYPSSHGIIEDTVRHILSQMTSTRFLFVKLTWGRKVSHILLPQFGTNYQVH